MIDERDSRLIQWLRFPLMVGVVFIHTDLRVVRPDLNGLPLFSETMGLFVDFVCGAAVPLFFFISGYLFQMGYARRTYVQHLRHRLRTLILPYVLWIVLCIAIVAACQMLVPGFRLLLHKAIAECSATDFLWMFWDVSRATGINTDQHGPLVGQFWFLQCLMVLTLLMPLLRWLVRRLCVITLAVPFIVYAWGLLPHYPGIHAGALFYYTLGIAIATHRPHLALWLRQWGWTALPIFLILYIAKHHLLPQLPDALWAVETLLMVMAELWLAERWVSRRHAGNGQLPSSVAWLAASSFFLFASLRSFPAVLTNLARSGHLPLSSSTIALLSYLLGSAVIVVVCLACYALMRRCLPQTTRILTGGR